MCIRSPCNIRSRDRNDRNPQPERVHRARRGRRLRVPVPAGELCQVGLRAGLASPGERAVDRRNSRRSDGSAVLGAQCVRGTRSLGLAAFRCPNLHSAARREKRQPLRAGLHSLSPAWHGSSQVRSRCSVGHARSESRQAASGSEMMHVIETGGLTLEPQTAAHAEEMFAVLSDPAIYEYENAPPPSLEWLRARFGRLESRLSANGREQWLNWVIRLPSSELIGYVQATVDPSGRAAIAYELSSAYWGRGLAGLAVQAMIAELVQHYQVRNFAAVFKRGNLRSMRLLERLGFSPASVEQHKAHHVEPGDLLMQREER